MRGAAISILLIAGLLAGPAQAAELPEPEVLRGWIAEMKQAQRGPFARIRWFCNDGTILPPKSYACVPHGGGRQHGEWNDRTKQLRAGGYVIANVLSAVDAAEFVARDDHPDRFNQMLIEQFLVNADDGWILRKARYYRGALQDEGERAGGRRLLIALVGQENWLDQRFVVLRGGARLLRHGSETKSVTQVRQGATALAKKDPGFQTLRNKIHVRPDASDAAAVRAYAAKLANATARVEYQILADAIDGVYGSGQLKRQLAALQKRDDLGPLAKTVAQAAKTLEGQGNAGVRYGTTAALMAALRDGLGSARKLNTRLAILDTSLLLEDEHFAAATRLRAGLGQATRRQRLSWLEAAAEAAYGAGLVTARQRGALAEAFAKLGSDKTDGATYKETLDYLSLVPAWASQRLRYHYQASIDTLHEIEPLAELFIPDQLRASPLFFYAQVLDGLVRDANRLAGLRNELFGQDAGAGLRSLNPGLARGTLLLAGAEPEHLKADGIYLLPETVAELPPVAGILTAGEGNPLSHVQLLARNLGIPNVAVDQALIERLKPHEGKTVILAVSPAGSVRLAEDDGLWESLFGTGEATEQEVLIKPDLEKLDLAHQAFLPLGRLRATDSGRVAGPKAAKLGELKHYYPEAVAAGLAIPFGRFKRLLDQPYGASGESAYDWMVGQYRTLEKLPAGSAERIAATEAFRKALERWIETAEPGAQFRAELKAAMAETFGADGSYGVFVRSDTNVEDLPGFTGAGLNLTVANAVGFEAVMAAIPRVWASPFTARAFAWRQAHMDQPEHVYPAILLLKSVNADKSGVLVTQDIDKGRSGWLSVAVNEGVGGAVDGQAAESLRIDMASGKAILLAQATATVRRQVDPAGGVAKLPASGGDRVLEGPEIDQLITLAKELPQRFPAIVDAAGKAAPADIEFGFQDGKLRLFQIRPFLESAKAGGSAYLKSLDSQAADPGSVTVSLTARPGETAQ